MERKVSLKEHVIRIIDKLRQELNDDGEVVDYYLIEAKDKNSKVTIEWHPDKQKES